MIVYAARPISSFGTDHDARQLAVLARYFPDADVLDPAAMFSSDEQWLAEWPDVLDRLDILALWADEEGMIGAGVLLEVADAIGAGLPVVCLDLEGQLRHFGGFRRGWGLWVPRREVGRLLYGPVVRPAEPTCLRHMAKAGT